MKALLDTNTWIALTVETHPMHATARQWYEAEPLSPGDLVFCRATEISFLRLITQAKVMNQCKLVPLTNAEAVAYLANVYKDPAVAFMNEPPTARALWLKLAGLPSASPHVWMDAYLAAFAISAGLQLVTFDRAFGQFTGMNLVTLEAT